MGLIKWICKRFKCESSCRFNEEVFDIDKMNINLNNYQLKYKDINTIHKILIKRKLNKKIII